MPVGIALCECGCGLPAPLSNRAMRGYARGQPQRFVCGHANVKHGAARHGGRRTPEYMAWNSMISRCSNPRHQGFHNYGGRGIRVCDRWRSFSVFLADMGTRPSPQHSIDRINNDGNYEPANCRWATGSEQ